MAKLLDKFNSVRKNLLTETHNSSEIAKINAMIQEERDEQEKLFAQIGRHYFSFIKANGGSEVEKPLTDLFAAVELSDKKIEAYQSDILRIKNVKRCPNCGRECSQDSAYCAGCGTQLPQEGKVVDCNHCSKCGADLSDDDIFCFNCGNKIEK